MFYVQDLFEHLLLFLPVVFGVSFFVVPFLHYTPRMLRRHHPTLAVAATVRKLQKKAAPCWPYFKRQTHSDSQKALLGFSEYRTSPWSPRRLLERLMSQKKDKRATILDQKPLERAPDRISNALRLLNAF